MCHHTAKTNRYIYSCLLLVLVRVQAKSDQAVVDFQLDFPFSEGVLHARALDLADFHSIRLFCAWAKLTFAEQGVHILVNNAGQLSSATVAYRTSI